jgi:hypothetical protein
VDYEQGHVDSWALIIRRDQTVGYGVVYSRLVAVFSGDTAIVPQV